MLSLHDLVSELVTINGKQRSGRCYVYIDTSRNTKVVNFGFRDGELTTLDCGDLNWRESIELLTSNTILKTIFVPANTATTFSSTPVSINIDDLLRLLLSEGDDDSVINKMSHDQASGKKTHLLEEATEILTDLLGTQGRDQVRSLARKYPPDQIPKQFLDACCRLVADIFGRQVADERFARLLHQGARRDF